MLHIPSDSSTAADSISDNSAVTMTIQATNSRLLNVLEKIGVTNEEYDNRLSSLMHLSNKIDFVDAEHSYPIRPGLMNIIDAIEKDGFSYTIDRYGYYMRIKLPNGKTRQVFDYDYGINRNAVIHRVLDDKIVTAQLLTSENIPTPRSFLYIREGSTFHDSKTDTASALQFAEKIGYPLIFKPIDGSQGRGVEKLMNEDQLKDAINEFNADENGGSLRMLQEFVNGNDIRVVYLDGSIELAYQRIPAHVIGNGTSTIHELLSDSAKEKHIDAITQHLHHEGRSLDDVLKEGEGVQIVATANIATGGTAVKYDFDEEDVAFIHNIAHKTGARYFGADVLTQGKIADGTVLELNKMPGTAGASKLEPGFGKKLAAKIRQLIKEDEGI